MSNKFLINSRCASRRSTSSPPYGYAQYQSSHSSVISTVYLRRHQRNCLPMNDCRSKLKQNQKKKYPKSRRKIPRVERAHMECFIFCFAAACVCLCLLHSHPNTIYLSVFFVLLFYFYSACPFRRLYSRSENTKTDINIVVVVVSNFHLFCFPSTQAGQRLTIKQTQR